MRTSRLLTLGAFVAFLPSLAAAGEPEQFGDAGQIVPSGSISLSQMTLRPPEGDSESATYLLFAPQVMFFVVDNFAIGGGVSLGRISGDDYSESIIGVSPSVGYNIRFTDAVSLMPTVGFTWSRDSYSLDSAFLDDMTLSKLAFNMTAPILIHVAPHFFIGVGPAIDYDLTSSISSGDESEDYDKTTNLRLATTIGGYF